MDIDSLSARKKTVLKNLNLGERIAEQESSDLARYFVETEQWRRLHSGEVDIIYGAKGAGKSALYSLLAARDSQLFDRGIIIVPAENPNGATAFAEIKSEPPTTEYEFTGLWKLYFVCLIARELESYGANSDEAEELYEKLGQVGLLPKKRNLRTTLLAARDYAKKIVNVESVEGGLGVDPQSGLLSGLNGKITFREPGGELASKGILSVDTLLEKADTALAKSKLTAWLLLDRLDVAFAQSDKLEYNALSALFKAYLDMTPLENIGIKIFLRTDIWKRITDGGFREASHITRNLTITWQRQSLLNLVVKRLVANNEVCKYYDIDPESVISNVEAQEELLKRMLPDKVDTGKNPATFDWMLIRTQDGTKHTAPRELIHLLSCLKDNQLSRLELGHPAPVDELLFDRPVFKDALKPVSEERLTKTLYAEYNDMKPYMEKLSGEKTQQSVDTLANIWNVNSDRARAIADRLIDIGFFESRGTKQQPIYWVPFLYRDALEMIQGEAK
jgi:hypothetical protein